MKARGFGLYLCLDSICRYMACVKYDDMLSSRSVRNLLRPEVIPLVSVSWNVWKRKTTTGRWCRWNESWIQMWHCVLFQWTCLRSERSALGGTPRTLSASKTGRTNTTRTPASQSSTAHSLFSALSAWGVSSVCAFYCWQNVSGKPPSMQIYKLFSSNTKWEHRFSFCHSNIQIWSICF